MKINCGLTFVPFALAEFVIYCNRQQFSFLERGKEQQRRNCFPNEKYKKNVEKLKQDYENWRVLLHLLKKIQNAYVLLN